jgi:ribonuclease Z
MHAEGRGGSAYALWLSRRPVIVVDMGADTPGALARAGAPPGSVEVLLITHLHADHVSGVADFLWGEMAAERQRPLVVAGPDSNSDLFPALPEFFERLIGPKGPFPTLSSLQRGKPFELQLTTLPVARSEPQPVREYKGVRITALAVPHGVAPALAYRLDGATFSVVLAGDQSGLHPRFSEFASNADALVVHATVNDRAKDGRLDKIVGIPERLGAIARASGVRRLVLSHLMGEPGDSEQAKRWSLADLDGVVRSVRREYKGPVTVASDFVCLPL